MSTLIVLKCSIGECKTLGTSVARVPAFTIWHEITGKHVVALLPVALEKLSCTMAVQRKWIL